jgi:hypothetical protein
MQSTSTTPRPAAIPASNARRKVIWFAVTLAILAYIDRVAISMAAPEIAKDLGLDKGQMGYVFGAFAIAYALFEIPGGWLGDWMGPRKVLDADRHLVELFHRRYRWMFSYSKYARDAFSVRSGRSRLLPQHHEGVLHLAAARRARARAGHSLDGRPAGAARPPRPSSSGSSR